MVSGFCLFWGGGGGRVSEGMGNIYRRVKEYSAHTTSRPQAHQGKSSARSLAKAATTACLAKTQPWHIAVCTSTTKSTSWLDRMNYVL